MCTNRLSNDAKLNLPTGPDRSLEDAFDAVRAGARRWAPRLPAAVTLVCAIGAGFAAADLGWRLYDAFVPAPAAAQLMSASRPLEVVADPALTADQLAASEAFGALDTAAVDDSDAPDSRLDLKLRGVIAAAEARYSRAFIANSDGQDRAYAIGAQVPGGALVHAIHPDRVVLSRSGSLETLRLPRESSGIGGSEPTPIETADLRGAQANPSRLLDWLRPVVATESSSGRQLGYRVYPGRDPDRFTKLGLMPGDLVTAVNGQPLDDPSRSMELMRGLTGSDNISLTIERDGAQRLVQIPVLQ